MNFKYKKEWPFEMRKSEAEEVLRNSRGGKVLVIVEKAPHAQVRNLAKKKYLVFSHLPLEEFYLFIRTELHLDDKEPLFFIVHNILPSASETMGSLYQKHHEEDFCLYIAYSNTYEYFY